MDCFNKIYPLNRDSCCNQKFILPNNKFYRVERKLHHRQRPKYKKVIKAVFLKKKLLKLCQQLVAVHFFIIVLIQNLAIYMFSN